MRPYRAKRKDNNEWVYGWYIKTDFATYIVPAQYVVNWKVFIEVIPSTVSQSTGKKDKKRTKEFPEGQEIFGGDIVKASIYSDEEPQILEVCFREGAFVIDYEDSESDITTVGWFVGSLEIIGNIHDKEQEQ